MTIVYRAYRPKRFRKRKAQAAAIAVPAIVTAKHPRRHGRFGDVPDMNTRGEANWVIVGPLVGAACAVMGLLNSGRRSAN